jgi:hypothetical protein
VYESLKKPEKPKSEAKLGAVKGTKKMSKEKKLKSKKAEENQVQVVPKLEDFNKDIDKCETEREAVIADEVHLSHHHPFEHQILHLHPQFSSLFCPFEHHFLRLQISSLFHPFQYQILRLQLQPPSLFHIYQYLY